jgi:hypothetical protein
LAQPVADAVVTPVRESILQVDAVVDLLANQAFDGVVGVVDCKRPPTSPTFLT